MNPVDEKLFRELLQKELASHNINLVVLDALPLKNLSMGCCRALCARLADNSEEEMFFALTGLIINMVHTLKSAVDDEDNYEKLQHLCIHPHLEKKDNFVNAYFRTCTPAPSVC